MTLGEVAGSAGVTEVCVAALVMHQACVAGVLLANLTAGPPKQ